MPVDMFCFVGFELLPISQLVANLKMKCTVNMTCVLTKTYRDLFLYNTLETWGCTHMFLYSCMTF